MTSKKMAVIGMTAIALTLGASGVVQAGNLAMDGDFTIYSGGGGTPFGPSQLDYSNATLGTGGYTVLGNSSGTVYWQNALSGGHNYLMNPAVASTTGSYDAHVPSIPLVLWGPGNGINNGLTNIPGYNGNWVVFDGDSTVSGSLSQTIGGLTKNNFYSVSFYWAAAQWTFATGATTEQFGVNFAGPEQFTGVVKNVSQGFVPWMLETFVFQADGISDTLVFNPIGTPVGLPPMLLLADVSVSSVPEPSSLLLFGVSLLALAAVWMRQRQRAKPAAV